MDFADLAAVTIHNVKNRLAQVAHRAELNGDTHTLREVLESAAALTSLLVYYRSEKEFWSMMPDACVPADLIEELAADMRRQTTLEIDADLADSPALAFYDQGLVRIVMLDAVYNAIRHAKSRIVIGARQEDAYVVLFVRDDGTGYPAELLASGVAVQRVSDHGTGIGLTLAARVAELHQHAGLAGRVELRNEPGACFRLLLPA